MFCYSCGGWRRADHNFCLKCGISLSSANQVSTFKDFLSQKTKERQTTFNTKSKKVKMEEFLIITIGIGSASRGAFKPIRGKSLPLKVKKHASTQTVLDKALEKQSSYKHSFRNDNIYKSCFPVGSEVTTLFGTEEPFTLHKHKEDFREDLQASRCSYAHYKTLLTLNQGRLTHQNYWWMVERHRPS